MTKSDFLAQLEARLQGMSADEIRDILGFYDEVIHDAMTDDGLSEEEAVARLGSLDGIVQAIRENQPAPVPASKAPVEDKPVDSPPSDPPSDNAIITARVPAASVKNLTVKAFDAKVFIRGMATNEVVIRYPDNARQRFTLTHENGILLLKQEPMVLNLVSLFQLLGWHTQEDIVIDIPQDFAADLSVKTSNGRLECDNAAVWGDLGLYTSNGKIKCIGTSARQIDIKTSNGGVLAEKATANSGDCVLKSSNGKIIAKDVKAKGLVSLTTSNGAIEFDNIEGNDIRLRSSNSRVVGVLPGDMADYAIQSATSNGKNNLPRESAGSIPLNVKTSNGRIEITFSKEI